MYKPMCPYYVSQTDERGTFDINCNANGKYKDCEKESFTSKTDRRNKIILHCNAKREYCETYKKFKKEESNGRQANDSAHI